MQRTDRAEANADEETAEEESYVPATEQAFVILDTGPLGTVQSSSPLSMHGASRKHGGIPMLPTMPLKAVSNSPSLSGSTASHLRTVTGLPLVADRVE